ncbi:MAG: LPP20 family lipoprotein [Campylobacterota bacterium]|nr:LPP20 family lipoprotein [Campylobacterota bacterium]
MKFLLLFFMIFGSAVYAEDGFPDEDTISEFEANDVLQAGSVLNITVTGQGIAPSFANPQQAYALAKRAAIADAYRLLAERIQGVTIEGKDTIKNMSIQKSIVRTHVQALIKNAVIVDTIYENGMCEVQMELKVDSSDF